MKLYIYDIENMEIIAIAEGETNQECEEKAQSFTNDYATTYSPGFGLVDGLIENPDAEII